ncbi:MAG TPA: sugar-binding protein [Paludibacteraceae bacterium]|nr:sugar-binding protein [Paludibacteraceae bacterium]HOL00008.1 sugar-binding protein [Paludibacteraceae bacterium]HPO67145.1 sugar-binding protein [Paludibacteraceae bacterium]
MKKISIIIIIAIAFTISSFTQELTPYQGSRIFWDINSQTTVFQPGNYARMIELQDGRLLAVAEALGGISITFSSNKGNTWTSPRLITSPPNKVFYAVPDVIQLSDGIILIGFNPRPHAPYSPDRLFGIRVVRSTDNGETWSDPYFIFDAHYTFDNGCWEPAFLELPSGEVQCYFANESEYTNSNEQNISMCRSFDKGITWSTPIIVSFRQGYRDGMPVPLLLKDQSEIVVIIEDNGWPGRGNFVATTVRTTLEDNWTKGYVDGNSSKRSMIFQIPPPTNIVSAAPYIRKFPWGETIASYQSNENRISNDLQYFDMYVVIGDERARNFKAKSAPFSLGNDKHAIWNSISVIDTGIIVALGSIGPPYKSNDVVMMKGYPLRQAKANYGVINVDGTKSLDEKWTTSNASQLYFGHITKNKATVDFLYDEKYLYLTSQIIDRNIINTGLDNDGIRFMIDADNISGSMPETGMYSFFFDTNGTVKFQRGNHGIWTTDNNVSEILYAVDIKSFYYNIEAAIPWSLIGKSAPPFGERMAIAIEIVNKEEYTLTKEGIADVDNNASWTWLEFQLIPRQSNKNICVNEDNSVIKTFVNNNILYINSPVMIKELSLFSLEGKLIDKKKEVGLNFHIPIPIPFYKGIVLMFSLENGEIINKKILF